MNCQTARQLLHPSVDGELDLLENLDMEEHLRQCAACAAAHRQQQALRKMIREQAPYYRAPASLHARLRSAARLQATVKPARAGLSWRPLAAAALSFVAVAVAILIYAASWRADDALAREVVSGHVRSMMLEHLTDVASTDQHTVKPWFDGKIDFAPPVRDFAAQGFPLFGGRLDYLDDRPVAALVYRRQKHFINLFIWPASGRTGTEDSLTRHGYNLIHWSDGAMNFWAVSDLNRADLGEFARLVRAPQPAATQP